MLLQDRFTSVLSARTTEELLSTCIGFANGLGFETVSVMAVADRGCDEADFFWVNNAPPAASSEFATNVDYGSTRSSHAALQENERPYQLEPRNLYVGRTR